MSGAVEALVLPAHRSVARPRSLERIVTLCTSFVVFLVGVFAFRPYPVGIFHDDGVYVILGKAIATGQGYRYLNLPGVPSAPHFPPIYPLFLAALWRIAPDFPQNMLLLLLAQAVLLGVVAYGIQQLVARRLGWSTAACAAFAVAATLSLPLLTLGSALLSEPLFLAALFPILLATEALVSERMSARAVATLGACAGLLTLVRTHGIVLVGACALVLALQRRWRDIAWYVAGALALIAPWQLWTMAHAGDIAGPLRGSYGGYSGWLSTGLAAKGPMLLVRAVITNARAIASLLADRLTPWPSANVRLGGAVVASALALVGVVAVWKRASVTVAFTLAYLAVVLLVPYTPWRYFWAAWPLVLLFIVAGAVALIQAERRHSRLRLPVVTGVVALLLACGVARAELSTYRWQAWKAPARVAAAQVAPEIRWVEHNTRVSDVLIADDEPLVYLFTGRQALPPQPFTAAEYVAAPSLREAAVPLRELLTRFPVRYVATIVPSTAAVAELLAADSTNGALRLRRVAQLSHGAAFEVMHR